MARSIDTEVYNQIEKMLRNRYDTDVKLRRAMQSMNLEAKIEKIDLDNLIQFLFDLSFQDGMKVIKYVLETPQFWPDDNDLVRRRNYDNALLKSYRSFGSVLPYSTPNEPVIEKEKLWGTELATILRLKNGISYDRDRRLFIDEGVGKIIIIPQSLITHPNIIDHLDNSTYSNDPFYLKLVHEINTAFVTGLYTSTVVLARKLIENLLIQLLIFKFPYSDPKNLEMYYDIKQRRHRDFSELIKILTSRINDFGQHERTVSRLVNKVTKFKDDVNCAAHTITIIPNAEEVRKYEIQEIIDLIFELMH